MLIPVLGSQNRITECVTLNIIFLLYEGMVRGDTNHGRRNLP